jgi:hypothetical protein
MSKLLLVLLIASVVYGVYRISRVYEAADVEERARAREAASEVAPEASLPALSPQAEATLAAATAAGAPALKTWLDANARFIPEPRLSAIQLDYAQILIRSNPAEARRIYNAVKARTPAGSPLAPRLSRLSKTFQ